MKKNYIDGMATLEIGGDNISEHLAWLLRMVMHITVDKNNDAINSVSYCEDLPKASGEQLKQGIWGAFYAVPRAIVINLNQHINEVLEAIQDKKHMNNSIRVLLLRGLLDTAAHEAWHAKICTESAKWDNDNLDEQGAKDHAWELSWAIAEHWDINIEQFGSVFDTMLQYIYKDLKEDVQEEDCKEWKKIQFHMLDNGINYFNPETGVEIRTIREVFQAQVRPDVAWIDTDNQLFNSFLHTTTIAERIAKEETNTSANTNHLPPAKETTIIDKTTVTTEQMTIDNDIMETEQNQMSNAQTLPTDYDPLGDSACDMDNPFDNDVVTQEIIPQNNPITPVMDNTIIPVETIGLTTAEAAPAVNGSIQQQLNNNMDVLKIQQIAEQVLRRMFHHVSTKCEFNTDGGYNNTNAVLDPINISDIEGASNLFAKQDTLDTNGVFQSHTDTNGFIKGLPTAEDLPRYTFHMNMGGQLHKRVFIAQNPEKKKADGITHTAFATKARAGDRIMMLLADNVGITADITLQAGSVLGQETFRIWNKK